MINKTRISKFFLIIYVLMGFLTGFLNCMAGCLFGWFIVMAFLSVPLILTGPKKYRTIGIVCCCIAMSATVWDYQAGKKRDAQIEQLRREFIHIK